MPSLFDKKKEKKQASKTVNPNPSVQGWLPVKDIDNSILKRKDNVNVGIVKTESINISLLTEDEGKNIIRQLSEVLNGIDHNYMWFTMPKPVDLDGFIEELEDLKSKETDFIRRKILEEDIRDAAIMASDGEAFDRHYYFIHDIETSSEQDENILLKRSQELAEELTGIGLRSQVSDDQEIRELLFTFMNPVQASFERTPKDGPYLPPLYGE